MRLLVLTVSYPTDVSYFSDWLEAFANHPGCAATVHNIGTSRGKRELRYRLRKVDAVVALHPTTSDWLADLVEATPMLNDRRVPLAIFIGNEFNSPFPWLADKIAAAKALQPQLLLSQHLQETAEWLYAETGAVVLSLPPALNPNRYFAGPHPETRRFDLASRSFAYPVYIGDNERNRLFARAAELASQSKFCIDVRLDERLPPDAWADLLRDSRTTLSTEGGTLYLERDDRTARRVKQVLEQDGRIGFNLPAPIRRQLRRLPLGFKDLLRRAGRRRRYTYGPLTTPSAETEVAIAEIFRTTEKGPIYGKCVNGRHFDALGTKTLQLLTPGRYNDILRSGEHYLEVASDGSNLIEMLERALDHATWSRITAAGLELGRANTYSKRVERLLSALSEVA